VDSSVATLFLGLFVGALSGILGIGGGVFLIPGLMYLFHFSQQKAQGTTLAAMVPPIGLFAAMQYYKQGFVDITAALCIACGFTFGAFVTAGLIRYIPSTLLSQIFGTLLLFLGVRMVVMSERQSALVISAAISLVLTWTVYFFCHRWGTRFGVRPRYTDVLKDVAAGSPSNADFQI
jgi:uncharacterized membrane protein YfcA